MNFKTIFRSHILSLKPYSSARDEYSGKEGIFLDANENPFHSVTGENFNRYPDPYQYELKSKLAKIKNVNVDQIFLGNGSDEPIDLLIKAICEPKIDNIILNTPTYGMYKVCADIQQVRCIEVPLKENFQLDLDFVFDSINANSKIIWICSPNNPSGNLIEKNDILQVLKAFPEKIVVVDEAYIDFCISETFLTELNNYENLVVLQTFSKAWGMAGLRIGVAYANAEIVKILNKIKYPYNLNILTQQKAIESIDLENEKFKLVERILEQREILRANLQKLSIVEIIYPSDSNILLVKFTDSVAVFNYLLQNKIIVRDRHSVILCENCLRISVGTKEENESLVDSLMGF